MPMSEQIPAMYHTIGMRVKLARLARGLTAYDLGRKLSRPRSRQSVSAMENGKVRICIEDLLDISKIVDEPVDQLMRGL